MKARETTFAEITEAVGVCLYHLGKGELYAGFYCFFRGDSKKAMFKAIGWGYYCFEIVGDFRVLVSYESVAKVCMAVDEGGGEYPVEI